MRNVVFVAPFALDATMRFSHGLTRLEDLRLLGVFQKAPTQEEGAHFADVAVVEDALNPAAIASGVARLVARHGEPYRITGILEPLQTPLAIVRRHFGVPGPDPETAERFREKALMKDTLRQNGLPCARHRLLTAAEEALPFVAQVGLPIVLKPPAGAGCRSTWRIDDRGSLGRALGQLRPSPAAPVLAEEYLHGDEGSCEMVVVGGRVRAHSISHYLPGPLEVMRTEWIQWVCLLPRDIGDPAHQQVLRLGERTVQVLGLEDGVAHMEWFRREDGTLAIGEIAARPPGGQLTAMTGLVHDADIYRTWARAVVDGAFDGPWNRSHAAATIFLRGVGAGRVARVDGIDEVHRRLGSLVEEARLPQPGAPKGDTYEGDGYIIVRHRDEAVVREAVRLVLGTVRVRYG
ncbi:MAG: ATP-grasp domain-containing protein [Deltaproteobacteria bacterium]|nr:ATP-grasp domain-containing protein [Deltaproteobacteria bacterium]